MISFAVIIAVLFGLLCGGCEPSLWRTGSALIPEGGVFVIISEEIILGFEFWVFGVWELVFGFGDWEEGLWAFSCGSATMTPCDVAALKKCLEEHKGDGDKCKEHIAAFKTACSASSSGVSSSSSQRAQSGLAIQGVSSHPQASH